MPAQCKPTSCPPPDADPGSAGFGGVRSYELGTGEIVVEATGSSGLADLRREVQKELGDVRMQLRDLQQMSMLHAQQAHDLSQRVDGLVRGRGDGDKGTGASSKRRRR